MKQQSTNLSQQKECKIKIEYGDSIRSIDLENLLSGLRMICQYDLAQRSGGKPRDFTDVMKIKNIEKGSIEINLFFDLIHINASLIDININLFSSEINITDILLLYLAKDKIVPEKFKPYIKLIKSSLSHFRCVKFEDANNNKKIEGDGNGDIIITDNNN